MIANELRSVQRDQDNLTKTVMDLAMAGTKIPPDHAKRLSSMSQRIIALNREMKIAKASPKDSRPSDSPCLEMPPRILNQIPTF